MRSMGKALVQYNILIANIFRLAKHGYSDQYARLVIYTFCYRNNVKTVLFVPYALHDKDAYEHKARKAFALRPFRSNGKFLCAGSGTVSFHCARACTGKNATDLEGRAGSCRNSLGDSRGRQVSKGRKAVCRVGGCPVSKRRIDSG